MFQTSLFYDLDQEEIEETVRKDLLIGSGFENSKTRIKEMFHQKLSKSDRIPQLFFHLQHKLLKSKVSDV